MKLKDFLSLTFLGTLLWNIVLVYLGRMAGEAWEKIASYVDFYSMIAVGVSLLIAVILGAVFVKKRFINTNRG